MKICVRKKGNVCTVYQDTSTGQFLEFSDYNEPPEDLGFPQTMTYGECQAKFRGHDVVYIEEAVKQPPTSERLPANLVIEAMKSMGVAQQFIDKVGKIPAERVSSAPGIVANVVESNLAYDKAISEFRILLARYYANPKDANVKLEVQAVGSFLITLWPDIAEKLSEAKQSFEKPKFNL